MAEDACDLIELDIDPLDAIVGHDAALAPGARPGPSRAREQPARRHPGRRRSRARRHLRRGCARRHRDVRAAPLPLRADGVPRRGVDLGRFPQRTGRAHLHPGRPRRARLRLARRRAPGEPGARRDGRRRRRLRPEDVHDPRGARRGARRQAPRSTGQVDRGPSREPDGGPARPRRPHDAELRPRRRRAHPRRPRPSSSRTSAPSRPPAAAPSASSGSSTPARTGSRGSGSRPRPSTRTRAGAARTADRG